MCALSCARERPGKRIDPSTCIAGDRAREGESGGGGAGGGGGTIVNRLSAQREDAAVRINEADRVTLRNSVGYVLDDGDVL